jgi:serine/threonine protein kinase
MSNSTADLEAGQDEGQPVAHMSSLSSTNGTLPNQPYQTGHIVDRYTEQDIQQVATDLLRDGHHSWSNNPRLYIILRDIGQIKDSSQPQLLDVLLKNGLNDMWIPITSDATLKQFLKPEICCQFLQAQGRVCLHSASFGLGPWDSHRHFATRDGAPFEYRRRIGQGHIGLVDEVFSPTDRKLYARKSIRKSSDFGYTRLQDDVERFRCEMQVLRRIKHRHCVQIVRKPIVLSNCLKMIKLPIPESASSTAGITRLMQLHTVIKIVLRSHCGTISHFLWYSTSANAILCTPQLGSYTNPGNLAIVMSPVADSNLEDFLQLAETSSEPHYALRIREWFGCLATAIQYLHINHIRHRDIKPANILVHGANVLLVDFELALDWRDLGQSTTNTNRGRTPRYAAPEVMQELESNSTSDIFSLGCVFIEMVTVLKGKFIKQLRHYFTSRTTSALFSNNPKGIDEWISYLQDFSGDDNAPLLWTSRMLQVDRTFRARAAEIVNEIRNTRIATPTNQPNPYLGKCCQRIGQTGETPSMCICCGMEVLGVRICLELFTALAKFDRTSLNCIVSTKIAQSFIKLAYTEIQKCFQEYYLSNR